MKLEVFVDGHPITIDVGQALAGVPSGPGHQPDLSVVEVEPGIYSVLLNGRSFEARVEAGAVTIGSRRYAVEVVDPRRLAPRRGGASREGRQRVAAPMPGKVVRVLVAEGDTVDAGQGIAVVEAMKMQNELKALKAGRVVSLTAREGATVSAGEVLAAIE